MPVQTVGTSNRKCHGMEAGDGEVTPKSKEGYCIILCWIMCWLVSHIPILKTGIYLKFCAIFPPLHKWKVKNVPQTVSHISGK